MWVLPVRHDHGNQRIALAGLGPAPSDDELKVHAITNICRCGTYPRIRAAGRFPGCQWVPGRWRLISRRRILVGGAAAAGALIVGYSVWPSGRRARTADRLAAKSGERFLAYWIKIADDDTVTVGHPPLRHGDRNIYRTIANGDGGTRRRLGQYAGGNCAAGSVVRQRRTGGRFSSQLAKAEPQLHPFVSSGNRAWHGRSYREVHGYPDYRRVLGGEQYRGLRYSGRREPRRARCW